jgi:DNA-binding response OmpR family regulator
VKALEEPRKLGLTSEGPDWTLKGRTIAELAERLGAQLRRQAQKDVGLG